MNACRAALALLVGGCIAETTIDHSPLDNSGADSLITTLLSPTASGDQAVPYHGYYFRILSRSPDGFTAVAYPAAYRSSGVMTFVVTHTKAVYEKDLGPDGARTVETVSKIQPDPTWMAADEATDP